MRVFGVPASKALFRSPGGGRLTARSPFRKRERWRQSPSESRHSALPNWRRFRPIRGSHSQSWGKLQGMIAILLLRNFAYYQRLAKMAQRVQIPLRVPVPNRNLRSKSEPLPASPVNPRPQVGTARLAMRNARARLQQIRRSRTPQKP